MDAIVLDGEQKSALAVVRALGRRGLQVAVGATRSTAPALRSRYAAARFIYPDPKQDRAGFVRALRVQAAIDAHQPVLYTFSDATTTSVITAQRQLMNEVRFTWPTDDQFSFVSNKAATYSEAKLLGVPVIPTYLFENEGELSKQASEFTWPMVVKPRRSISIAGDGLQFGTATFVHSLNELTNQFAATKRLTGEAPLIQPFINGEEYGVELVCREGEVVAGLVHHRVRSLSPTGGASVVKETVIDGELYEALVAEATKLSGAITWSGPLMVEYKVDADSRTPRLMELNGRWWGSLPLVLQARLDLPFAYYELLTDASPTVTGWNQRDVTTSYFLGDVRHVVRVLLARDPMRALVYPERRLAVRDFFRTWWRVPTDVWSWRDPNPSLWQYIDIFNR